MTQKSSWFDKISAASAKASAASAKASAASAMKEATRGCQHPGCKEPAEHRAPQGRDREGQYFWFCLDHVREYNKTYNYFSGMTDAAVAAYQKESIIGHRPTWTMGHNGAKAKDPDARPRARSSEHWDIKDPFNLFAQQRQAAPEPARRPVKNAERKALEVMNLDDQASAETIKARYKELVKRLHPDANGGDRGSEDKLRAVIQAYNYLKKSGLAEPKGAPAA
ncbi:molecular chaperone DnaJ [Agaricicola taiwanensis]|uniref:Molecular chaperone DnaJ n=1 Tax=Agaricicola taiwanensis TaxID=591372 RepID=A0A8J3E0P5_9RHOB|nr:J domain-containing protein [Agaricicola taiwanensis]GGE51753.1 molecular chaperone DnaJ [Agaricicola taiwanensis]